METMKEKRTMIVALVLGVIIIALFFVKNVTAEELTDISEGVTKQEAFEEKDINHIILKEIEAPNKLFIGWTDKLRGTEVVYKAGDKVDIAKGLTLYPLWENIMFTANNNDLTCGEDLVLDILKVTVDHNGLDISPKAVNLNAEVKNKDCSINIEISDVKVDKDIEKDGMILYPDFEDESSLIGVNVIYKLQAIHGGKIIGTSYITVPIRCTPDAELFAEPEPEEPEPAIYYLDEAGNTYME